MESYSALFEEQSKCHAHAVMGYLRELFTEKCARIHLYNMEDNMDLETTCTENVNLDTNSEDSMNSNNSSTESLFIEERISLQDFVVHESDKDENYCLGVINIFGNKVGFIVDTYFNKKYVKNKEISLDDTVIFDSSKVKFREEDFKLQTVKNIYLVKYVLGGVVINEKTGREQRTINYDYPIEVLKFFSRKSTVYIHVENDDIICRYKNEESKYRIDLDNEDKSSEKRISTVLLSEELQEKIINTLKMAAAETGVIYASAIPGILGKIGIPDYKRYASTIAQFCEKYAKDYFEFKDKVKIDRKVHSGVLFLKKELKDIDRTEELLLYDDPIFDGFRDCEGVHFGIINRCTNKNGFINQEYVDKRVFPDYLLDGSQSTIFETSSVNFEPNTSRLRTVKYIYLVAFFVKGTAINTKTGEEQPALDYSQPVSIIKAFSRKEYVHIQIAKTGILN